MKRLCDLSLEVLLRYLREAEATCGKDSATARIYRRAIARKAASEQPTSTSGERKAVCRA